MRICCLMTRKKLSLMMKPLKPRLKGKRKMKEDQKTKNKKAKKDTEDSEDEEDKEIEQAESEYLNRPDAGEGDK